MKPVRRVRADANLKIFQHKVLKAKRQPTGEIIMAANSLGIKKALTGCPDISSDSSIYISEGLENLSSIQPTLMFPAVRVPVSPSIMNIDTKLDGASLMCF